MGKYLMAAGIILMMLSCGKDIDEFVPRASIEVPGDINQLLGKLRTDLAGDIHYTISCPCQGNQAYEIDKDLVLVIPYNFIDPSIYPCPTGTVDLNVTVCDTKGEIMVAGIPTISEGKILDSRIEFSIGFTDGVQHFPLNHGKQIRFLVNDPDPRDRMGHRRRDLRL